MNVKNFLLSMALISLCYSAQPPLGWPASLTNLSSSQEERRHHTNFHSTNIVSMDSPHFNYTLTHGRASQEALTVRDSYITSQMANQGPSPTVIRRHLSSFNPIGSKFFFEYSYSLSALYNTREAS